MPTYEAGRCLLRDLRAKAGLTQEALASASKVPAPTISALENNRYVLKDLSIAKSLANALDCAIDDLYAWVKK